MSNVIEMKLKQFKVGDADQNVKPKVWKSGDVCTYDCIRGTLIIEPRGWFFKPHGMMRIFEVSEERITL